jgi:tetratricopeptide (TPR) repeat protein
VDALGEARDLAAHVADLEARIAAARPKQTPPASVEQALVAARLAPRGHLRATVARLAEELRGASGRGRLLRVRLLKDLDRLVEAEAELAAALTAGETDPDFLVEGARIAFCRGDPPAAQRCVESLLERAPPESPAGLFARVAAGQERDLGRLERAAAAAERGYLSYLLAENVQKAGLTRNDRSLLQRALAHAERAVALEPENHHAVYIRSAVRYHLWIHGSERRPEEIEPIIDDLRLARELVPSPIYWSYAGKSYLVMAARPDLALLELDEAVARAAASGNEAEVAHASYWQAIAHLRRGAEGDALEALRRVAQRNPKFALEEEDLKETSPEFRRAYEELRGERRR